MQRHDKKFSYVLYCRAKKIMKMRNVLLNFNWETGIDSYGERI